MPTPEYNDPGFLDGMEDLLGMDANAAKELLARMDVESLTALTDAVTNKDKDAAEKIVGSFDTDEDVNPLFRGSEIEPKEDESEKPPPNLKRAAKDHQFSFGDSVYVMRRDEHGKKKFIGATVYKPIGPHKTVGIKIDGKPKMTNYNTIFVEEGVLGMVGVPNLQRIQQLAGMQPGTQPAMQPNDPGVQVEQNDVPDSAAQQAMSALDALEQALPNVRLGDLKAIRQRIVNIQTCMNEGQMRAKKVE